MSITDLNYYIIETPIVLHNSIRTYNLDSNGSLLSNDIKYNTISTIYYSDIVSPNVVTECKQFNISNNLNIQPLSVTPTNNYTVNGPYSLYHLSKYIANKLLVFSNDIQLVNKCNNTVTSQNAMTSDCTATFKGYTTNSGGVSTNPPSTLPEYQEPIDIANFPNRKKELSQQLNDINQLIITFKKILEYWNNLPSTNSNADTDISKEILNNYQNMLALRNELDMKVGEIYRFNDSKIVQSEHSLDRIVYTNVILTILATSLIYIVLIKL